MFEEIDPRSPTPLYEQIAARIRVAVATSELNPGEPLPSVRGLASRIRINPATVVQAYRDLEKEGFVEMRHGAGTFVREVAADHRTKVRANQAMRLVGALVSDAARLGISVDEIGAAFEKVAGATR